MAMSVQLSSSSGLWVPNSPHRVPSRGKPGSPSALAATPPTLSSQPPTIQIVGLRGPSWSENGIANPNSNTFDGCEGENNLWSELDTDLYHWTKALRPVQWFPGHIAKAEKELKEQLRLMDVVIEVRDGRIPMSTTHPQMDLWLGNRKRILVLNREDMISTEDRNAWAEYFTRNGTKVVFSNGQLGMGTMKLGRLAKELAANVNVKRRAKDYFLVRSSWNSWIS
uniref:G domain-containing protein n=1 Tax=Lotus japonicus TaxID=34305 RepID=I3SIY2_LOTJA|nr:unknown [Lotus japonicus]